MVPFGAIDPVGDILGWVPIALAVVAGVAAFAVAGIELIFVQRAPRHRHAAPAPA